MSTVVSEMIDPTKTASYRVRLGQGLLAEEGLTTSSYSTVTYNHKPDVAAESPRTTTIFPSDSTSGFYKLKIDDPRDPTDNHTYEGSGSNASNSYALIYDPDTDEWILDRVDTDFVFNLTSTPSNPDGKDLAAKYPQLDLLPDNENDSTGSDDDEGGGEGEREGESEGEGEGDSEGEREGDGEGDEEGNTEGNGDGAGEVEGQCEAEAEAEAEDTFEAIEDDAAPADDDNPYDWRHFVTTSPNRSRSASRSPSPSASGEDDSLVPDLKKDQADAPPPNFSSPPTTPTPSRPPRPNSKPKPKPKPKPRSRRLKSPPPPPKDEDADNEASDADADADANNDNDVLTIEMEPDTRPRRHLGAELARPASAGPISLRSAASSVSPRPHGREAGSEGEEESESEAESDEDDGGGVEVVPFSSSPPAPPPDAADAHAPTPGDAEDALEAELAQALELQEGSGGGAGAEVVGVPARRVESSSESEEE